MKFWGIRIGSILLGIGACFLLQSLSDGMSSFLQRLVVLAGLYVTLAVSLNLINGITGQFSIGHAAFYQIGAYTAGYVSQLFFAHQPLDQTGWIILMMVVGAMTAAVAGFVVGLPSLRLRGDYLAIVTLGFGEIIRIVTQNVSAIGGASGLNVSPHPTKSIVWLAWMLAFLCIATCRNLMKAAHGLPFLAIRDDEIASGAMGVNVTGTKVAAFVIGSAFAGAAGAFYAHNEGFLIPTMFTMETSFIILTMVVLGGTGSITGSIFAAITLSSLPELLRDLGDVTMAGLLGATIALIVTVSALRWAVQNIHGPRKPFIVVGMILAGVVAAFLFKFMLLPIPVLASTLVAGSKLRLVLFAVTLVILMLLRPQGIFAHHELSLDSILRRKKVAA